MKKNEILLPEKRHENATSENLDLRLQLETNETLLRGNERDILLNLAELYDGERNQSIKYKIYGKIKMIFRNMYYGTTTYNPLLSRLYYLGDGTQVAQSGTTEFTGYIPYDEFAFLRRDIYRENVVFSGDTQGSYTPTTNIIEPNKHQQLSLMDIPYHNWNLYLSYVYDQDYNYPLTYTLTGNTYIEFLSGDGIPCRVEEIDTHYKLTSPIEHGFKNGDGLIYQDIYLPIDRFGDELYNSEKYVIYILKTSVPTGIIFNNLITIKRCTDRYNITGSTSNYYIHKHKIVTNTSDYIMDKIGFETPIFEDEKKLIFENNLGETMLLSERNRMESILFDFKESFMLSGLTNNLGYTPTEVYVSVIFRNGSGYFDYPPKVGYKFNFHNTWVDKQFEGSIKTTTPFETSLTYDILPIVEDSRLYNFQTGNELNIGDALTGAFVEYNPLEMKERVISEEFHKLSIPTDIFDHDQDQEKTLSGVSLNNLAGLYYQPHYRVKLRELSPYVETFNGDAIEGLPDNAKYDSINKIWKWRDLYDHGYVDADNYGTNFPFTNGCHYVKSDINFYLRNEANYTNKQDGIGQFKNIDC